MGIRKGQDYIVVGLQAYDSPIGSNCINIAREISKNNRVLYVNYPWDISTYWRQKKNPEENTEIRQQVLKGEQGSLVQETENLWVLYPKVIINSINWMPDGRLYDLMNKRNNYRLATRVKEAITELGFKDYILFNDSDMFRTFYFKELLKPKFYMYYSRDNLITQAYFKKHGVRLEAALIKKADAATANSLFLRDYCKQFNPNSHYVGQGCETDLFDPDGQYERSEDLPEPGKPIIGYIGALLKKRLDIQLLEELSLKNPQWNFVMVGPEDEHFMASALHERDNVFFLGPKKPTELPQYLYYFDVAINPQALNELTIGNYPRKIDEYLAMGKPTVATKTRAMEIFSDHVYLAEDLAEYEKYITRALEDNSEDLAQERIRFAGSHTWEASVDEIYKVIESTRDL